MDRKIMLALIFLTFFLVSCGKSEVTATQRTVDKVLDTSSDSPTGAAVQQVTTVRTTEDTGETGTTAAEALKDLSQDDIDAGATAEGGSIYSGTTSTATGEDALKEKTRQAYSTGLGVGDGVEADDQFGPKYHNNLPDGYGNDDSAGE